MTTLLLRLAPLPPTTDASAAPAPRLVSLRAVDEPAATSAPTGLQPWVDGVAESPDGCLVLDHDGRLVALSDTAARLLGLSAEAVGRRLLDQLTLVDFDSGAADPEYGSRIPPLAALRTGDAARSLIRLRHDDGAVETVDVVAAALHDVTGEVIGAISFVAPA